MKWAELIDKYFGLISKKSHIFFVIWLWSTKYRGYLSSEYSDADSAGHEHFESSTITNLTCNEGYRNACIWLSDPILLKPRKEVWIVQARSLTFFMKFRTGWNTRSIWGDRTIGIAVRDHPGCSLRIRPPSFSGTMDPFLENPLAYQGLAQDR